MVAVTRQISTDMFAFTVTEHYVKENRGRSTVAARLFSIEPVIKSHSASTGKTDKSETDLFLRRPLKTPHLKHRKLECDFKWGDRFRL